MKLQLWPCWTCRSLSTPLTMLHYQVDLQIGMEYLHLGRGKFGFLLTCKIGTNPQKIKSLSDKVTLSYGVPHSSVLGPVLFILYTTPPSTIIPSFDINHHLYADDTHIYMSLSVSNAKESLENLQHCVMAVSAWMLKSRSRHKSICISQKSWCSIRH